MRMILPLRWRTTPVLAAALALTCARAFASVVDVNCGANLSGDTSTSIRWFWGDNSGSFGSYHVYDAVTGTELTGSPVSGSPTFYQTSLVADTPHSVKVQSVADNSLAVSATCYTLAAAPIAQTGGAAKLVITSTEPTSISLNWDATTNPPYARYAVYFTSYPSSGSPAVTVATITANANSAYFGGLTPSSYYSATVYGLNESSATSAPLTAGTTFTMPARPDPITIQAMTPVSINFSWNANSNSTMTYYEVTYSPNDAFATSWSTAVAFSNLSNKTSYNLTGLLTSTAYWLRVRAENPLGVTSPGYSTPLSTVTTNGGAPLGSWAGTLTAAGATEIAGTLNFGGGQRLIDLRSPAGAFLTNTTVTISTYSESDAGHFQCPNFVSNGGVTPAAGIAFSISANSALQPMRPLILTGAYVPTDFTTTYPLSQLAFARYDPASGTCVPLQTAFNTSALTITTQINHFSVYELVAVPLSASTGSARIYPNPFHASTDGYVTIDQVPASARVRIFTLRGEKILDATANGAGNVTWAGDNGAGRPVASGLYLVEIESGGSSKTMKLAVIR